MIAALIPALDEEVTIAHVVAEARSIASHVIVVDNGSTDATARRAAAAGATVVSEPRRGYGAACLAGIRALPASIEIVIFVDADGSGAPRDLARVVEPIVQGRADLVVGSRVQGRVERGALTPAQRTGNWLAARLLRRWYGLDASDLGPLRAIRAAALRSLGMRDRGFGWTVEMQARAARAGLRVREIPVEWRRRRGGRSKISGTIVGSVRAGATILWTLVSLRVAR